MKYTHLIITSLSFLLGSAQDEGTGINTFNPKGILHVDGAGDNANTITNEQAANDFIILPNGNVGIGTITPSTKITIETGGTQQNPVTGLRLVDGNQGAKKVLTSDANGVATWNPFGIATPILGTFTWGGQQYIGNTNWNSIGNVVLPPGLYTIEAKIHIIFTGSPTTEDSVRIYISDKNNGTDNNNPEDTAILGSSRITGLLNNNHSEIEITILYYNPTNDDITLYLNLQSDLNTLYRSNFHPGSTGVYKGVTLIENYFYAIPYSN